MFVRTKSPTGSKFSKIIFYFFIFFPPNFPKSFLSIGTLFQKSVTRPDVLCNALNISQIRLQVAPQQSAKFRTAFLGQFRTSLRNDSVVNYESIWTLFSKSVTRQDVLCNALNISQIRLQRTPQDSVNCGRNFAKRKQSDAVFAGKRLLRMVIIDIYSN